MRDEIHSNQTASKLSLRHLVKGILVAALIYQRPELAILNLEKLTRLAEFDDVPGIEDHLHKSSQHETGERMSLMPLTILSASIMVCNLWAIVNSVTSDPRFVRSEFWITVSVS